MSRLRTWFATANPAACAAVIVFPPGLLLAAAAIWAAARG